MEEKTLKETTVYDGRVLRLDVLDIEMENGVQSIREVIRHRGAVAVLSQLPDGRFVFVKQFRKAMERDFVEVVAGLKEEGESPEACARRELLEETGWAAESMESIGTVCPSPGYTDEVIDIFFARLASEQVDQQMDDDEHLEVICLEKNDVDRMIARGEIQDAKTLAAWLLYEKLIEQADDRG